MINGQAIISACIARFFVPGQPWVYWYGDDGSIVEDVKGQGVGPGIDCSHFVEQAMLAAGYDVGYEDTASLNTAYQNGGDQYYTKTDTPEPGDLILFGSHVGIVASVGSDGTVYFLNAETGGIMQARVGPDGNWYGHKIVGYLEVNDSVYEPSAAESKLDQIDSYIDNALIHTFSTRYNLSQHCGEVVRVEGFGNPGSGLQGNAGCELKVSISCHDNKR